ncbi:MAG: AMP-binding protein, partial [Thermoplasmata archaeon]|nr:AMP-binding protein [Thermoplasmata archaeon]
MALIPDALRAAATRFPDRTAVVVDGADSMSFAEWEERSNRVARGLVELGLRPGDRVAILASDDAAILCYVSYMAAQKAGAVPTPINTRLSRTEVSHVLEIARPAVLVASASQRARARDAASGLEPAPVLVGPGAPAPADDAHAPPDVAWESLEEGDGDAFQVPVAETDLADILYTSGTTGLPKGVASTHENVLSIDVTPSEAVDGFLHSAPLGTVLGTYGAMLACLRLALTNFCLPSFSATRFAELIGERRPGWLLLVPAHVHLLREAAALEGTDTSSVSMVLCGTAPMPPATFSWLAERFPTALVINAYSLTEAGDSACLMSSAEALDRPGSVGKPLAGGAVRVVDDAGNDLGANEVGELVLRIRRGRRFYFGDPEETDRTWRDGWVSSGDLGYLDDDGYVYLVDRKKDMIIRGGYNVYSVEVENAIHEHPDVVEVAVLGIPHKILGQDVAAVARLQPGTSVELESLRGFLSDRLADYKRPRTLVIVEVAFGLGFVIFVHELGHFAVAKWCGVKC